MQWQEWAQQPAEQDAITMGSVRGANCNMTGQQNVGLSLQQQGLQNMFLPNLPIGEILEKRIAFLEEDIKRQHDELDQNKRMLRWLNDAHLAGICRDKWRRMLEL